MNLARKASKKPVQRISDRSAIGRKSRRKGHSFERYVAQLFRRWFPDARRGLQYRDGKECCDVEGTPYWIECKRRKRITTKQAVGWYEGLWPKTPDNRIPILVYKSDNHPIETMFPCEVMDELMVLGWPVFVKRMEKRLNAQQPFVKPFLRAVPTAPTKEEV